jgi:hypothetical protein
MDRTCIGWMAPGLFGAFHLLDDLVGAYVRDGRNGERLSTCSLITPIGLPLFPCYGNGSWHFGFVTRARISWHLSANGSV